VYPVQEWAEVHRLFLREGLTKTAIAERLGMSRNTVSALLGRAQPPRYQRKAAGSMLEEFADAIAGMLAEDAKAPATVILERLRRFGYRGGITILKEHLARVRPNFLSARSYQRTSYLPGELAQFDWWHTGAAIPVGKGATREAFGLVVSLPHSAAHAVGFTFARTVGDFCPALVGCLGRLGGVPMGGVVDNDTSIVASRVGGVARLHDEVAALFGHLGMKPVVLRPRFPEAKGQVERTIEYLERSFLPLRRFEDLADLQAQHDRWAAEVAFERHHRRVGAKVADAWRVERGFLHALPEPLPDVDRHLEARVSKDGFVRVAGVDYSLPPGLAGRQVSVRLSLEDVRVRLEGTEIARHARSYVPADVVLAPTHVRALRLARQAKQRLVAGDVEVPAVDLARYDLAVGVQR
jgi:transposase